VFREWLALDDWQVGYAHLPMLFLKGVSPMGHAQNELKNLQQWQEYLLALHPTEIDMGLDRVRTVYERLDTKSPALKIIIGGTNGKGSTAALLESILLTSGYRVGVYSSPHLVHF